MKDTFTHTMKHFSSTALCAALVLPLANAMLLLPIPTLLTLAAAASAQGQYAGSKLVTINHDGSSPQVVFETKDVIEAPNWSTDGKWLVYNSNGELYRISAAGGADAKPEKINIDNVTRANNDHVLSRDGNTIYFSDEGHIYAVSFKGGTSRRVSNKRPEGDRFIKYWLHGISPDGMTATYVGMRGGNKDIWTIPAKGGNDVRLTTSSADDDGPDYSPDGKWIYFNSNRSGSHQIWRIPAAGGKPRQITKDQRANWFPHPSPDGKWIVYLSFPPGTEGHPQGFDVILRRAKPDGSELSDVYRLYGGQGTINVPSWSPDSKRFAFVEYRKRR